LTINGLHGVISQKTLLFITTVVRTSNPTISSLINCRHFSNKCLFIRASWNPLFPSLINVMFGLTVRFI
jgi:hypothetical protein